MRQNPVQSELAVVKFGGHAMDDPALLEVFVNDLRNLHARGRQFILIHGGGPQINSLLQRLNIESRFENGLRVTDAAALAAVEMALCAAVNKSLCRELLKLGCRAVGICGEDAALLVAKIKNPDLGRVGEVALVNTEILRTLLSGGFLPVVAPLALDANFEPLNVNADTAAGAIAGAMRAACFILVSDVPGVLDKDKNLLAELSRADIAPLIKDGTIGGGMIPKVECCMSALAAGCKSAIILNGKQPGALAEFLENRSPLGTVITD